MTTRVDRKFALALLMGAGCLLSQPTPAPPRTSFKFDFGPGKAPDGYTKVPADLIYSDQTGFGFDFGSKPVGVGRGEPILFSVKVPEGNYRITVTLGDSQAETRTTIRTEAGHLMAANIVTAPGKFVTRSFIANADASKYASDFTWISSMVSASASASVICSCNSRSSP